MNSLASEAPLDPPADPAPAAHNARPLQRRLTLLALGGLLPLLLAATASLLYSMHQREREVQRTALHTARAIGVALRAEIEGTIGTLEALSTANSLQEGRLSNFEDRARRLVEARGWRNLTLADPQARLLVSTSTPALPAAVDTDSLKRAIETRAPVVGNLFVGRQRLTPAFAVRYPIVRNGEVQYIVSAVLGSEQVLELVREQNLPDGQVAAIFDPSGVRIARTIEHSEQRPSESLRALMERGGDEGMGRTQTLEGVEAHTGFHRVAGLGWTVAVGIPVAEASSAVFASTALAAAGLLASLGVSAWLAWVLSRRVSRPITQLKAAAAALGRGEPLAPQRLEIEELDEVANALVQASREREAAAREKLVAEAERERLLAQATAALARAEAAARSKDEFLAVLGHELRNPLAPISSALHLMSLKGDESTRAERRIVERQLNHMTRLVDDLLDVSRITGGKLRIRREPMRIGPWIEQVVETVRGPMGTRTLQVDLPDDVAHAWVQGDSVRLAQVLGNLLGNAIKFTQESGRIAISGRIESGQVVVDVSDDGIGLSADEVRRVFDLFYQAPQGQHRTSAGLGLGLTIVRSLVEMHEGLVQVRSDGPGLGSTFSLRLPLVAEPPTIAAEQAPAPARPATAGARVLVVDDNVDAADTGAALLEACGFEVAVAYAADEALRRLEAFHADVALLDIGLPGMDGYQLARAIRTGPRGQEIRLMALTGYGQESDVRRARDHGFDAHMTKPVDVDALLELLQSLARH
ncbi:hybrid sensor histidine kinase/response regulator [Ramlibacter henchirensis]|uniref:histidine kinase n=1 Tax=Ramlibacter henchirensis TaxID=204072 RepID=A0A4Z0C628_9BURK|nr:ATP-binding protein [Ramlibacter henchirensis]TFZ06352.1 hybrid sensor histidine kinase/response regulator [Ramlibacter henchirensis]